ncbi:WbqC family protein [Roseococcus sp. DSY-14]|uniref:WbqC family protein n=1 Tax=Roseococcus sp. DSY-14 TaxID=3369650 RepID=UPI00387B964F
MGRTVVVTQGNFLPWRGWFALLARADAWVVLDGVQFTRRDWRSRNRIKTPRGPAWLSVPVQVSGRFHQAVEEARIADPGWAGAMLGAIAAAYRPAAHFAEVFPWLAAQLRAAAAEPLLSRANEGLTRAVAARLGLGPEVLRDRALLPPEALRAMDASERLAALAAAAGATRYLTGPAARAYLDPSPFRRRGIALDWMDYGPCPPYPQPWGPFLPGMSVVDLLLNAGPAAPALLGGARP